MDYFVIGFISIVVVGIMEVVKRFLPENVNAKVTSAISLGLGILLPIGYGIVTNPRANCPCAPAPDTAPVCPGKPASA